MLDFRSRFFFSLKMVDGENISNCEEFLQGIFYIYWFFLLFFLGLSKFAFIEGHYEYEGLILKVFFFLFIVE